MRLTTRTSLAVRTLMFCAINSGQNVRKREIALACNASENHLAQVINTLARHGFLETRRGRTGGLSLARAQTEIGLGEVMRLFESGTPFAECHDLRNNRCPLVAACRFRSMLDRALAAFYATLDGLTLADLVAHNADLEALLSMTPAGLAGPCPAGGNAAATASPRSAGLEQLPRGAARTAPRCRAARPADPW